MKSFKSVVMEDTEFVNTIVNNDPIGIANDICTEQMAMCQCGLMSLEIADRLSLASKKEAILNGETVSEGLGDVASAIWDKLKSLVQSIFKAFMSFVSKIVNYIKLGVKK